jgi:hypothetical protein
MEIVLSCNSFIMKFLPTELVGDADPARGYEPYAPE